MVWMQYRRSFSSVARPTYSKSDAGNGHTVPVAFDESCFGNGVLWQQDAEQFVCMEPWNGWANSVNEAGKHETLAPGAEKTFAWSITIE